jgi:hypothetical protein
MKTALLEIRGPFFGALSSVFGNNGILAIEKYRPDRIIIETSYVASPMFFEFISQM